MAIADERVGAARAGRSVVGEGGHMLLTISTTHRPATDLGYLLHKNPSRTQTFGLSHGHAHVFYPEVSDDRCTAALLVELDPVALSRGKGAARDSFALYPYVNDRPYAASSFLSVAIASVLREALNGRSKERQQLADAAIPLEARIPVLPCRGGRGEDLLRALFEPLGYEVEARSLPLDERFPSWGMSSYVDVTLRATLRLKDLLGHLYVLIPVLDNDKHYWVNDDEVEKLLQRGEGWLRDHPERETITRRYLKGRRELARELLLRLSEDDPNDPEEKSLVRDREETAVERAIGLNDLRLEAAAAQLAASGAARVLDLGCGEGNLLRHLLGRPQFTEIVGVDVSFRALKMAQARLKLDTLPEMQRSRIGLLQGSLVYDDARLHGFGAAAVIEVIEHLDPWRLDAFTRVLFGCMRPGTVVITTPNREYNVNWPSLPAGRFRHGDHRFEWTREEFRAWGDAAAASHGYAVEYLPVGPEHPLTGPPTQMGVFRL